MSTLLLKIKNVFYRMNKKKKKKGSHDSDHFFQ